MLRLLFGRQRFYKERALLLSWEVIEKIIKDKNRKVFLQLSGQKTSGTCEPLTASWFNHHNFFHRRILTLKILL
jgi:hypothetical protein